MAESSPPGVVAPSVGGHLSIGEVLALLLEEFPDVTISKIRFLESQGLIDPERTASGYRKFYADDVELLRCILREQRENYLPLRVIKDRIDSGEIDPTGEQPRPRGIKNVGEPSDVPRPDAHPSAGRARNDASPAGAPSANGAGDPPVTGAAALFQRTDDRPPSPAPHESTSRSDAAVAKPEPKPERQPEPKSEPKQEHGTESRGPIASSGAMLPGLLLNTDELCAMAGITRDQLAELTSYGVVAASSGGPDGPYDEDAVEIATISKRFLDAGIEPRHLRGWRGAAEREAGLLAQLIQPLLRQRNPEARAQAVRQLDELEQIGGRLRAAMMRAALRHHVR
ncbi:MAG TPA: MerR family transcriptional regulator [Ilumatobacteraceae bacterium]|nr:MerR family transcriptional regulator [Ilumatobacteraceae bacterium]